MIKQFTSTRSIVYTAMIAALYFTLSTLIQPLAFGPLQLRVSTFLYPLALFNPLYVLGFGLGSFLTNITSPFGAFDWAIMPMVTIASSVLVWIMRRYTWLAVALQAIVISLCVSIFPLGMGGGLPVWVTFPGVCVSQLFINLSAWFVIWKPLSGLQIWNK